MDNLTIFIAKYFVAIPVIVALYLLVILPKATKIRFIKLLVLGGILSLIIAKIGNHLIQDPRPFVQGHFLPLIHHGKDNGFPSDHTLLASFIAWTVLSLRRGLGIGLLIIALIIGLARMQAGLHHSWDILGSFIITAIGFGLSWLIWRWLDKKRRGNTEKTDI